MVAITGGANPADAFKSYMLATGESYITGPEHIPNMAMRNCNYFGEMIRGDGRGKKKLLRGGSAISEKLIFKHNGTHTNIAPGAWRNWKNPQLTKKTTQSWRFDETHASWLDVEIELNDVITGGREDVQYHQFFKLKEEKMSGAFASTWEGLDDAVWRIPDARTMEGSWEDGKLQQMSLLAYINEFTNGLFNNFNGGAFTSKQGLDPTDPEVNGKWEPWIERYTSADTAPGETSLLEAMDMGFMNSHFKSPPMHSEYFSDNSDFRHQRILTDKTGRAQFQKLLRDGQDHWIAGKQDPAYPDPSMHGVPVMRVSGMDGLAAFENAANNGLTTAGAAEHKGPRYIFHDTDHLYPTFHTKRYFKRGEIQKHPNVPDMNVLPFNTTWNMFCDDMRLHGTVAPSGNVLTY